MAKKPSRLAAVMRSKIGANDKVQKVQTWIDTGVPQLNEIMSGDLEGGVPLGRIITIDGDSSTGKTWIATQILKSAQQMEGVGVFLDHECSFDSGLAEKNGLDIDEDNGNYIYKQPTTFEDSMALMGQICKTIRDEELIDPQAPIVIVADSLASMVPEQKFAKTTKASDGKASEKDKFNMNDNAALARCTSAWFPTLAQWCRTYNATIVFLNQIRDKVGVVFGDSKTAPGGSAPVFYASVRIRLSAKSISKDGVKIGQEVKAACIKNKVAQPFLVCSWNYYYDTNIGLDRHESLLEYMITRGYVEKSTRGIIFGGKSTTKAAALKSLRSKTISDIVKSLKETEATKEVERCDPDLIDESVGDEEE